MTDYIYTSGEVRDLVRSTILPQVDMLRGQAMAEPGDTPARRRLLIQAAALVGCVEALAATFGFDPPAGSDYPELGEQPAPEDTTTSLDLGEMLAQRQAG